ncbi:hypothetical protein, partial [Legionella erythra]
MAMYHRRDGSPACAGDDREKARITHKKLAKPVSCLRGQGMQGDKPPEEMKACYCFAGGTRLHRLAIALLVEQDFK